MENIHLDHEKIKIYSQIQQNLCDLEFYSSDEEIDIFINEIPKNFLTQKEDLMIICQMISNYTRNNRRQVRGNSIKIFEKILNPIKSCLQNESTFFWEISGGLYFFKLWMYEEGLISIEQIIQSILYDKTSPISEFFIPEFIEKEPELFEKEVKHKVNFQYTQERIEQIKELRKKYFKWVRDCGDFHDPSYREIEKNPLRYSIKIDDVDSFQKIISNTKMSLNSKIRESFIENFVRHTFEFTLIEFALIYDSVKIIKFLLMNNVDLNEFRILSLVKNNNYDIIHIIEPHIKNRFSNSILCISVGVWNFELIEYAINNYDYGFLEEEGVDSVPSEMDKKIIEILDYTIYSSNFLFFQNTLLPFLIKNPRFVNDNVYQVVSATLSDLSCFFAKEFLKFPGLDINHRFNESKMTLLTRSMSENNLLASSILVNNPKIDINAPSYKSFSPLEYCIGYFVGLEFVDLICKNPNFDINLTVNDRDLNAFEFCVVNGNYYALKYIIDNFPSFEENFWDDLFYSALFKRHLMVLKIILKVFLIKNSSLNSDMIIEIFRDNWQNDEDFQESYIDEFQQILNEINNE